MILINSCPKDALGIFQPFLPVFAPIGLGYLAAVAEREGIPNVIIDEQIEKDMLPLVERHARRQPAPHFFGFSVLTAAYHRALRLSRQVKDKYPDSTIVFGGAHPTAMPEEALANPQVDFVIRGEGEGPLLDLYRRLREGKDVSNVTNLSYRRDGRIVHNPLSSMVLELDQLPSFPYHRFKQGRYDMGFIVSSRGCPYNCIFCSNRNTTGRRYRFRSPELVVEDIDMLQRQYGVKNILFLDDNLLVNKKRIYFLMDEIRKRGLHERGTFSFQARGDNVDRELLQALHASGFRSIFFGLETASERLMKVIDKGETVEQCRQAAKMAKELGFHVSATFMYALPGETHQDRMDCLRLSKELQLDMVRYNNATPYPGTKLYAMGKDEGRLKVQGVYENFNSVSTFIENPFRKIPFSYVPAGASEDAIRHDILVSYLAFYIDPRRLKRILTHPDQGVGWFNAGGALLAFVRKIPALAWMTFIMSIKFGEMFFSILLHRRTDLRIGEFARLVFSNGKTPDIPPPSRPLDKDLDAGRG